MEIEILEKYWLAVKGVRLLESYAVATWTSEVVLKTLEAVQQLMTDPHRYGLDKLMYLNEVDCYLRSIFGNDNNMAAVGWRLQSTGNCYDEFAEWVSRFCVIHLEGYAISDGEVESDLTEHRVIWNLSLIHI